MTYRNDLDAAFQRAQNLERELRDAKDSQQSDQQRIAQLQAQLEFAHNEITRAKQLMPGFGGPGHYLPSNATTVLVLGILSLVICGLMGPFAWHYGNVELQRIDSGVTDPAKRGEAVAGRICGIISSVLLIIVAFGFVAMCASLPLSAR